MSAQSNSQSQSKPRARDLGIPFDGTPGDLNAITDVKGIEVGHTTLITGEGKLQVGAGPVRTGVTAILPNRRRLVREVQAGSSYLSSEDPRLHFGLGTATRVRRLVVHYSGGGVTRLRDVAVDHLLTIP